MKYTYIIVEKKDKIGTITINRPEVLNALNSETIEELINAVQDLEHDQNIHVAIITGEGRDEFGSIIQLVQ